MSLCGTVLLLLLTLSGDHVSELLESIKEQNREVYKKSTIREKGNSEVSVPWNLIIRQQVAKL
jgi:hypothetical protein